jgi:hypothetical protein
MGGRRLVLGHRAPSAQRSCGRGCRGRRSRPTSSRFSAAPGVYAPTTQASASSGNRQHHPSTRRNPHSHPPGRGRALRHGAATRGATAHRQLTIEGIAPRQWCFRRAAGISPAADTPPLRAQLRRGRRRLRHLHYAEREHAIGRRICSLRVACKPGRACSWLSANSPLAPGNTVVLAAPVSKRTPARVMHAWRLRERG